MANPVKGTIVLQLCADGKSIRFVADGLGGTDYSVIDDPDCIIISKPGLVVMEACHVHTNGQLFKRTSSGWNPTDKTNLSTSGSTPTATCSAASAAFPANGFIEVLCSSAGLEYNHYTPNTIYMNGFEVESDYIPCSICIGSTRPSCLRRPKIIGKPTTGQVLSVNTGVWINPPGSFVYEWVVDAVTVATATTYTVKAADIGKRITVRLRQTGITNQYAPSLLSTTNNTLLTRVPTVIKSPKVTGVVALGNDVTVDPGQWSEYVNLEYQWKLNGENITNAVAKRITLTQPMLDGYLTCELKATSEYNVSAPAIVVRCGYEPDQVLEVWCEQETYNQRIATGTAASHVVQTPSANTCKAIEMVTAPELSGIAAVPNEMVCTLGSWLYADEYEYQWLRNDADPISGATGSTYTLTVGDNDAMISCRITARNTAGQLSFAPPSAGPIAPSAGTIISTTCDGTTLKQMVADGQGGSHEVRTYKSIQCGYAPPVLLTPPKITGVVRVGETLTAVPGTWQNATNTYYRWYADGVRIMVDVTSQTLLLTESELGKMIYLEVIGENTSESITADGGSIGPVLQAYPPDGTPLSTYCQDDTLVTVTANGSGGTYLQYEDTSRDCTPPTPPSNTVAPFIGGEVRVGETIALDKGQWIGAFLTFTGYYTIDGIETAVSPSTTYIPLELTEDMQDKPIQYTVTASNAWGEVTVSSEIVYVAPFYPEQGENLGTMCQGFDSYNIVADGSGGATYALRARYSNECGYEGPPVALTKPQVLGIPKVGENLTFTTGTWSADGVFDHQWLADGIVIPDANSQTLPLTAGLVGKQISVQVTGTKIE